MKEVRFLSVEENLKGNVYVFEIDGQVVEFVHAIYVDPDTGLDRDGYYPAFWKSNVREYDHPTKTTRGGEPVQVFEVRPFKMKWEDEYNDEFYDERFDILRELNENVPWDYEIDWELDMYHGGNYEVVFSAE